MAAETLKWLRRYAIAHSLVEAPSIQAAVDGMGFVQADPIRSPARAQDLILRHRVDGYRAGDLERQYASLDLEEDYLYAYGFVSRRVWNLLHPRKVTRLGRFERKVLDFVSSIGEAHPASLAAHLGTRRIVNAWGGQSKATTHALEWLHRRGLLRVARRESGIRVYQPQPGSSPPRDDVDPSHRMRELIRVLVHIFAPGPEKTLHTLLARFRHLGNPRQTLSELVDSGEFRRATVAGMSYIWPDSWPSRIDVPSRVRFLAPFDPVVWDRRRFEQLWGWSYRFEAYTPPAKRVRGYYAMPLLWRDAIPGWANAKLVDGHLDVEVGFVARRPAGRDFERALDQEIARLAESLGTQNGRAHVERARL